MIENFRRHQTTPLCESSKGHGPWTRCFAAIGVLVACAGASGLADFTGRWDLDSTRSDRIDQAIEACIADYPEDAKLATRERLQETNPLTRTMYFTPVDSGTKVLIGYDGPDEGTAAPLDGAETLATNSNGESFQMTVVLENGALVESFQANNGSRTNTYTVSPDGRTLFMQVEVESPYMPTTLGYTLAYGRLGQTAGVRLSRLRLKGMVHRSEIFAVDGRILRTRSVNRCPIPAVGR